MYSSADICSTSTLDKEDGSAVMTMNKYRLGIDIGSTTVKIAILDDDNNILFSDYERHFANIQETLQGLLEKAVSQLGQFEVYPVITGSGGLTLAKHLEVPFTQEVVAVSTALTGLRSTVRCCHRAWWRGCKDYLLHKRYRPAYEWYMCRWYWFIY